MAVMTIDDEINQQAALMISRYGAAAARRAAERVNAMIEAGDPEARDFWAQVVHEIHLLEGVSDQRVFARH